MPTYEYRCNACKREFEYEQRMSDDDLVKCEACGEDKLEKLISMTAFQLKGGGWYKDLYSSTAKAGDKAVADAKPAAAESSSPSSDSTSSSTTPSTPAPASPAPSSSSSGGGAKE